MTKALENAQIERKTSRRRRNQVKHLENKIVFYKLSTTHSGRFISSAVSSIFQSCPFISSVSSQAMTSPFSMVGYSACFPTLCSSAPGCSGFGVPQPVQNLLLAAFRVPQGPIQPPSAAGSGLHGETSLPPCQPIMNKQAPT
jgi:hypothetical protein